MRFSAFKMVLMSLAVCSVSFGVAGHKQRLLILTDIGGDPDDQQSMVRLLLYANEFDLEGLVATSTRSRINPDQIYERIEAYREVRSNLVKHAEGYPTAKFLRSLVKTGTKNRNMTSVGPGKSTEGSRHIISVVDKKDERPLWITVWGAPTDLAQALWDVSHSRSKAELDAFISRMRIYDIAGQDDCGGWICHNFPGIFWLRSVDMFQAISIKKSRPFPPHVTGPNLETFTTEWVASNVRNHGPLGALYPERRHKYEGDTPAYLHLLILQHLTKEIRRLRRNTATSRCTRGRKMPGDTKARRTTVIMQACSAGANHSRMTSPPVWIGVWRILMKKPTTTLWLHLKMTRVGNMWTSGPKPAIL
jgi:hypothetical protein